MGVGVGTAATHKKGRCLTGSWSAGGRKEMAECVGKEDGSKKDRCEICIGEWQEAKGICVGVQNAIKRDSSMTVCIVVERRTRGINV